LKRKHKATLHRYNRNQHPIFKYHTKASTRFQRLQQKQRELVDQIMDAEMKLKQHLSPKEHERSEWNEWFHAVQWANGKQADPNQEPEAHVDPKPPISANPLPRFMEGK
jgi:hypothetical protein